MKNQFLSLKLSSWGIETPNIPTQESQGGGLPYVGAEFSTTISELASLQLNLPFLFFLKALDFATLAFMRALAMVLNAMDGRALLIVRQPIQLLTADYRGRSSNILHVALFILY